MFKIIGFIGVFLFVILISFIQSSTGNQFIRSDVFKSIYVGTQDIYKTVQRSSYPALIKDMFDGDCLNFEKRLEDGENPDLVHQGSYVIHGAAVLKETCFLKSLIKHGSNLEVLDSRSNTPLIDAIEQGLEESINILVENGAEVNVLDGGGFRTSEVLAHSLPFNSIKTFQFLVDNGLEVSPEAIYFTQSWENYGKSVEAAEILKTGKRVENLKEGLNSDFK